MGIHMIHHLLALSLLASAENFRLAAENPSIGPYAINTYHTGAGLSYMTTTSRDVNSGALFYFNNSYLTQVEPDNIPTGAFIAYVDVPVGANSSSLTSFSATSDNLIALNGNSQSFYVCSALSFSTNITSVVYSTSGSAPANGGGVVDVDSCYAATLAQIAVSNATHTATHTTHNGTWTTHNATHTATRNGTWTTTRHPPTTRFTQTTVCPTCTTHATQSTATRTSAVVTTATQVNSGSRTGVSLFFALFGFFMV